MHARKTKYMNRHRWWAFKTRYFLSFICLV